MSSVYKVPTFNLVCGIWRGFFAPFAPPGVPDLTSPCQLRISRAAFAVSSAPYDFFTQGWGGGMWLNLPKGTEIQGIRGLGTNGPYSVEVPLGSGRYYVTQAVDDVAKGFNNEYRTALILGYLAPNPIP